MAVFGGLFLWIFLAPDHFDRRTQELAIAEVERRLDNRLDELAQSRAIEVTARVARSVAPELSADPEALRLALDRGSGELIADILSASCRPDCERRANARKALEDYYDATRLRYGAALERIERIVVGEYDAVMADLRTDLRIFAGTNLLAMIAAFLLVMFRGFAARQLLLVSLGLTAGTITAISWYVFGQDWLAAVLFREYWGWAYAVLLGILSALMVDIAANKARITSWIGGGVGVPGAPC